MTQERILVCTPTLHRWAGDHRVDNLERTIQAVRSQTYGTIEHIVVKAQCNQGADCPLCEETRELAARYALPDGRFRLIELSEPGDRFGYVGRNLAIQTSDAPLIAYLDDDNWWEPNHLESLVAAMKKSGASFAYSASRVRSAEGKLLLKRISPKPYFTGIDLNEYLHKRELIEKYGFWNLTYNADWEAVENWLKHGEKIVTSGIMTSNYTLKPGAKAISLYFYSYYKHKVLKTLGKRGI
ncbi:MAG TPA: glycosyltransferase family 2 protein [bacterium]|jgi:glycosyltransferase involved in cell wall biosynthesis